MFWGGGDGVGGMATAVCEHLNWSLPPSSTTNTHTRTQLSSFYIICLWHNCRPLSLVPSPLRSLSLSVAQKQLPELWIHSANNHTVSGRRASAASNIILLVTNGVWDPFETWLETLESQLEALNWILVQTKMLKQSWVLREEVLFL